MIGFFFWIVPIIVFVMMTNAIIKSIKENTSQIIKLEELLEKYNKQGNG